MDITHRAGRFRLQRRQSIEGSAAAVSAISGRTAGAEVASANVGAGADTYFGANLGANFGANFGALAPRPAPAQMPLHASAPLRVGSDLLDSIKARLRPIRANGRRIEVARIGRKKVVHHSGLGGGGSPSCGSVMVAKRAKLLAQT